MGKQARRNRGPTSAQKHQRQLNKNGVSDRRARYRSGKAWTNTFYGLDQRYSSLCGPGDVRHVDDVAESSDG